MTMLTSLTARTRKRGYTLIEMTVVTVILVVFSALVVPSYIAIRDGQKRRAFYPSVVDLAATAREWAISRHRILYLETDSSTNMFMIKQQKNDSTYQAADGGSGSATPSTGSKQQDTTPQTNIGTAVNDRSNDTTEATLPVAPGVQFGNYQLSGNASDSTSWKMAFYPDGSCDSGAVELNDKGIVRTLVVNRKGGAKIVEGSIPDSSQDKWSAGNYVQRQQ